MWGKKKGPIRGVLNSGVSSFKSGLYTMGLKLYCMFLYHNIQSMYDRGQRDTILRVCMIYRGQRDLRRCPCSTRVVCQEWSRHTGRQLPAPPPVGHDQSELPSSSPQLDGTLNSKDVITYTQA